MIIKPITTEETNKRTSELLETHRESLDIIIPPFSKNTISLGAFDGEEFLGGITGEIVWNYLHISLLAVNTEIRKQGVGSKLLTEAEKIAKINGCELIVVETMSWQAPDFYQKNGFTIFGELKNIPVKSSRKYYLVKYIP